MVAKRILGGSKGYPGGIVISILKRPPSYGVPEEPVMDPARVWISPLIAEAVTPDVSESLTISESSLRILGSEDMTTATGDRRDQASKEDKSSVSSKG